MTDERAKKRNKFNAETAACSLDGVPHTHQSRKEQRRCAELQVAQHYGHIRGLKVHPQFKFIVDGQYVGRYTADAAYYRGDQLVVEDVKGGSATKTEAYGLRRRLMKALYGIRVEEV